MKPGTKPKPVALLKAQGTYDSSRHARRAAEPAAPGALDELPPPDWMSEQQQGLWRDILNRAPRGILRQIDLEVFTAYVEACDRYREAVRLQRDLDRGSKLPFLRQTKDGPVLSPYLRVIHGTLPEMIRLAAELGFTPSARAAMGTDLQTAADRGYGFVVIEGGRSA